MPVLHIQRMIPPQSSSSSSCRVLPAHSRSSHLASADKLALPCVHMRVGETPCAVMPRHSTARLAQASTMRMRDERRKHGEKIEIRTRIVGPRWPSRSIALGFHSSASLSCSQRLSFPSTHAPGAAHVHARSLASRAPTPINESSRLAIIQCEMASQRAVALQRVLLWKGSWRQANQLGPIASLGQRKSLGCERGARPSALAKGKGEE